MDLKGQGEQVNRLLWHFDNPSQTFASAAERGTAPGLSNVIFEYCLSVQVSEVEEREARLAEEHSVHCSSPLSPPVTLFYLLSNVSCLDNVEQI